MPAERKWVYWHRVTWVADWVDDGTKVGSLIGLKGKDIGCMKMVFDEERKSLDLKEYIKLEFLGRMLRTATAKEVHDAFKDGV